LHEEVLHRLFAEVVIDAVNLVLVEHGANRGVELARGSKVFAERLLDDHLRVLRGAEMFSREPAGAQVQDDRREDRRRSRDVEQPLHVATELFLDGIDVRRQPVKGAFVVVAARDVAGVRGDPAPHVLV
jgi:hypothetical protein